MKFHIGDVLSIATGRQLSLTNITGINKLARHMVGDEWDQAFATSQIIYREMCKEEIFRQYPQLKGVIVKGVTSKNIRQWLKKRCKDLSLPEMLEVKPINWKNFKS